MDEQRYQAVLAECAKHKADTLADAERRREMGAKEAAFHRAVADAAWEADPSLPSDERFQQWGAAFCRLWRESENTGRSDRYRQLVEHYTRPENGDKFYLKAAELLELGAAGDAEKIIAILRGHKCVDYQLHDRSTLDELAALDGTGQLRPLVDALRQILFELGKRPEDAIPVSEWRKNNPVIVPAAAPKEKTTAPPRITANARPAQISGDGKCTGDDWSFQLEENEAALVRALAERQSASLQQLRNATHVEDVNRVLTRVRAKYPQLAELITLPGGRGKGGYRTTIIVAPQSATIG